MATARETSSGLCGVLALLLLVTCNSGDVVDACTEAANDLYAQRVEPVLTDDQPATCNQCHLSGVDLSLFVRDTPCETMACLIEQDLVNLEAPEQSTVLGWIQRAKPDSELITADVIQAEYDAFHGWIDQVASCGACAGARCNDDTEPGFCDLEVEPSREFDPKDDPGGCDDKTLERLFLDDVYTARGRCYPCHYTTAERPPPGAVPWLVEAGNCEASSLATMRNVVNRGYVNVEDPLKSLLLLKPLAEEDGGLEHGGHDKFTADGDPVYANFVYWLTRYATCASAQP